MPLETNHGGYKQMSWGIPNKKRVDLVSKYGKSGQSMAVCIENDDAADLDVPIGPIATAIKIILIKMSLSPWRIGMLVV